MPQNSRLPLQARTALVVRCLFFLVTFVCSSVAVAHGLGAADQQFLTNSNGTQLLLFVYLGAKHMVTGYDHLLFILGIIFFLYRLKDVAVYVTLFAIGHSTTLLWGVLGNLQVNPYLVDAIIGLSVTYKAFENLGGFKTLCGFEIPSRAAVLFFGFFHGFGLATKLQEIALSREGLVVNMIAFNVGVEIGQFLALAVILVLMNFWRQSESFGRLAGSANGLLMTAGFVLAGFQLTGYMLT
jgi:hypothetical protein